IVPDLPVELEAVILKALEKHPVRRFQSCRAMAEALQGILHSSPTTTSPQRPAPSDLSAPAVPPDRLIRLVLADDHSVLRKALVSALETQPEFHVVGEAGDGDEALEQTLALRPDVLVLDLNMPGKTGLDVLPIIRAQAP